MAILPLGPLPAAADCSVASVFPMFVRQAAASALLQAQAAPVLLLGGK